VRARIGAVVDTLGLVGAGLPPPWCRRLVSVLIALHFLAIVAAVTSADSLRLPSPFQAIRFAAIFRPYLQLVFLKNPYRFFAPDPAPTLKLYFHVLRSNGTTAWVEFPRRADFISPSVYHRYCKMPQHAIRTTRDPVDRSRRVLNRVGEICISSYVRQIAKADGAKQRQSTVEVQVEVYEVSHGLMSVAQVREGWEATDLRLYRFDLLGRYMADGRRIDVEPIREVRKDILLTQLFHNDLLPRMSRQAERDLHRSEVQVADAIGVPEPILAFMTKSPGILGSAPDDLVARVGAVTATEMRESPFGAETREPIGGAELFPL